MKANKFVFAGALVAVLVAGLLLRCAGLKEPFGLHPDERPISQWMERMHEYHSLLPKCYAGGFFVLADATRNLFEWVVFAPLHRWHYFTRATDQFNPEPPDVFTFGRPFNAVLGTLVVWLAALFARRTSRSRAAALAAAALMAVAAYPVEHAHYLESDVAMLASVALALYLLVRAIEKKTLGSLAAAAFAAGFAAGTKFPMALLLAPLLAAIRLRQPATSGRARARRLAGKIALALALALAGFVVASPDALHVATFVHGLRHGETSVYAETAGLLGAAAKAPYAREWMNAANMARFAGSLGAGWLLVAALGLPCCFLRRFRAFWPATLLFPALHLWFIVFHAPWSRSQEFMALIPNFCLWAALPTAVLWNVRRQPALGKAAALALVAVALLPAARNGVAMSSQFAWEDTRRLANRLLKTYYPAPRVLGTELYTAPAEIGVACHNIGIGKYESAGTDFFRSNEIDYVLLNVDAHGRGVLDPRTGKLFPQYADRMDNLLQYGQRLAAFGSLDSPAPQATFRAPGIELWSCPDARPRPHEDIGAELPRPTVVQDVAHTTWFRGRLRAGPRFGLLLDKHPREVAIGGPGDFDGPVFFVLRTHERGVAVRADGFGRTARLALAPYDADVLALERPWWRPRWARFERVVVRAETGGPTLTYLPCYLRVAFDPLEAAAILLDDGHPERAVAFLRDQGALANAGPFWQALAGEAAARPAAEALLAQWHAWLARDPADPPPVLSGGVRLETWQDFARIRLTELDPATRLPLYPTEVGFHRSAAWAQFLPVLGAPQRLALLVNRAADAFGNTNFSGQLFLDADETTTLGQCDFLDVPDVHAAPRRWDLATSNFPRQVSCAFRATSGGSLLLEDAQFLWNWRDMLAVRAEQLRRALAAPQATPPAFRYADWLAVRACRIENGQAVLDLEALQDFIPPFAIQLQAAHRRKWRKLGEPVPLPRLPAPWLAGERRTVAVPLPAERTPAQLGLALATAVPWHSSLVPFAGAPAKRPFPVLADLLAQP